MRDWLESLLQVEVPLVFLVLLRLVVGYQFLAQGYDKYRNDYIRRPSAQQGAGDINPLRLELNRWIEYETTIYTREGDSSHSTRSLRMFSWYRVFLERAVKEHIDLFALLVTVAELALGLMLILGLLVRVVSVIGILLVVNYLLATWHIGFPYTTLNAVFIVSLLIFGVVSAGRCLGIDSLLHDRFPEIPIF